GTQVATITAQLSGWANATGSLSVLDNETLSLALFLPGIITEGSTVTGTVSASGAVASNLVVTLTSDTVSRLTVPATVTIASGTSSTTFNAVAVDNALSDGSASATVSASAAGYAGAGTTTSVRDNDVHHFGFAAISSPQTKGVPFNVTVTAYDLANNALTSYNGAPGLTAAGTAGGVAISPTNVNGFVNGVWTGQVTAFNTDTSVVLSVSDGVGHTGESAAFDVINPTSVLTVVEPMTPQTLQPGQNPRAQLVAGADGALYGTTVSGGASNQGAIFKITTAGVVTTLANFYGYNGMAPNAGLILASDGNFYGTTTSGGANNLGTVFRMTPSGTLTTLAHLTTATGGSPRAPLVQALDGQFYGTTSANGTGNGTIFRMTSSGVITVLVNFSGTTGSFMGSSCQAGLIQAADGNLYGVTSTGGNGGGFGTVFRVTTSGTFTSMKSFTGTGGATLGSTPLAALVQASDGALYGTTNVGGTGNFGTVFKITTVDTGTFTHLLSFAGTNVENLGSNPQSALVQWSTDGSLYGMTNTGGTTNAGTLFKVTTAGVLTTIRSLASTADGANPVGAFTLHGDGSFYATCNNGGSSQVRGSVIKLTPSTGTPTFSRIYSFFISPPMFRNMILGSDGNFYGGQSFGAAGLGALVKMTPAGTLSQLTSFTSNNFAGPYLLQGSDGNLYGSMPTETSFGQIFKIDNSGTKTVLATLTGTTGALPGSTIIHGMSQASDGDLFGVTSGGGATSNNGTVFKITTGGIFTSLVSFTGNIGASPGASPQTRLVEDGNGDLWGTTQNGGTGGFGTVFKISKTGAFTNLVQFTSTTGAYLGSSPNSNLLLASDGNFYGTTNGGGTGGFGTIYRVAPDGTFTSLVSFTGSGGAFPGTTPSTNLVQGGDGHLYGTTTGGGAGSGTVYRMALPSGAFTSLVQFTGNAGTTPGSSPHATLRESADGYFYGTTSSGGFFGLGTVFRVNATGSFQSLYAFGTNNDGGSPNLNGSSSFSDALRLLTGADGYLYGGNASTIFRVHQQPAIQAVSVSGLATTSATLNGTVLPNQDAASVFFQYGLSSSFGSQTSPQNIVAGAAPVVVNAGLTGLQSGAVYYWRMVTVTSQGTFYSAMQSFATPGAPLAITGSWVNVGQTGFSLDGTVNPLGSSTDWYFEYGTTTAYGSQTTTQNAGGGITNVLVNSTITGLLPGTTYHVRLVAVNATGTTQGDAQVITTLPASTSVLQPQAQFINTGTAPLAGLYKAADGQLYGSTSSGGTYGSAGTVFRVSQGGSLSTMANFYSTGNGFAGGGAPQSRLVQAGDGNFYGTTSDGGTTSNYGTVFRLTPAGLLTTLVSFNNNNLPRGADPSCGLTLGPDGSLYGVTQGGGTNFSGTVFKVTTSGVLTTLVNFTGNSGAAPGSSPRASLVLASDGNFYGTTATGGAGGSGTIFRLTPAGALTSLVQFTGTTGVFPGATPTGSLLQGADGNLYGTTVSGGANSLGSVFRVTLSAGFTSLVSFSGTTGSTLGTGPKGGLVQLADGTFYGTTQTGGENNLGTVFSMTPAGELTTLISFSGSTGTVLGSTPQGDLVEGTDGSLYGATNAGGLNNNGTIFKITPQGLLRTLVHFSAAPNLGRLAQGSDGKLYGATLGGGGAAGVGTLQAGLPGAAPTRLATLNPVTGTTALNARAGLLLAPDGSFYGTTVAGGAFNSGSVFKITPAGVLTTLVSFTGSSVANPGSNPQAPLILGADGKYLGTTNAGGTGGFGTIFRMTDSGVQTTLISFNGTIGANNLGSSPQAPLLLASDGNYYGTTTSGGSTNFGTFFRLTPAGALTTLATFTGTLGTTLGSSPSGLLVQGADGAIYGTTNGGGLSSAGTVFKITTAGALTTLANFTGNTGDLPGSTPAGGLQAAPDGCFYGATSAGGAYGLGTIFRVAPDGSVSSLYAFSGRQDGNAPTQGLAIATDGYLYGGNANTLFRLRQPPVVIASASLITESTATLNGSITGETHSGTVQFEYGPTTAYGNSTPAVNFNTGTTPETVFAPLEDLQPYQTYHYRLVATTAAGVFASPNRTFTTSSNATFDAPEDVPVVSDGFNAGGQPLSISLGFAPT
ncbi:MAG: choice-of-anchor tandem repeat GloVer-containing protein, partial [Roseimicrobium sp.]